MAGISKQSVVCCDNRQTALIQGAREAASFDIFELTCLIHGGEDAVMNRRAAFERVETIIGTRDTSKLPRSYGNQNREQAYEEGLEWGKAAFEDGMKYKHNVFEFVTPRNALANASPFGIARGMFEPALRLNASKEQQARWILLSQTGKILGTYCQTELAHGSFVRGIETTAEWDPETDEFVIHSPTTSSTKFWPGALGFSTTHVVLMARLITRSKDYGPHLFMVQIRSCEDGAPMPGIRLGDVGLKMSYNGTCNGFAVFDHVRIPRTDMLMLHSQVSRNGSYSTHPSSTKLSYSTMLMVRSVIVRVVGFQLAQAVTIAVRYSVVREQGLGPIGTTLAETSIMDYKSQNFRLLTLISKAYAMLFAFWTCDAEYKKLRQEQENDDHTSLPYVHSLASGLKAWATQEAADGAEDARKCCGGHGFMNISGFPEIVASVTAACTFEGENFVLWQQAARYLFKCVERIQNGEPVDARMSYLADKQNANEGCIRQARGCQILDSEIQLAVYRHRAATMIFTTYAAVHTCSKTPAEAWNDHMLSIIAAARAHTEYIVLSSFIDQINLLPPLTSTPLRIALTNLRSLFALSTIINPVSTNAISWLEHSPLSASQLRMIRELVNELLEKLAPEAVAFTDAWDFTDASLCSALGMWDGNVYENIMRWVEQIPINQRQVHPGWGKWVAPVLKAKL